MTDLAAIKAELRTLLEKATPGPWDHVRSTSYRVGGRTRQVGPIVTGAADIAHGGGAMQFRGSTTTEDSDAALIVAAINALALLLADTPSVEPAGTTRDAQRELPVDEYRRQDVAEGRWPSGISDGLLTPCTDCGERPRFDYIVTDEFWRRWAPSEYGVVCLPCLDKRCGGVGLADAVQEIVWTGTSHSVALAPKLRHEYAALLPTQASDSKERP